MIFFNSMVLANIKFIIQKRFARLLHLIINKKGNQNPPGSTSTKINLNLVAVYFLSCGVVVGISRTQLAAAAAVHSSGQQHQCQYYQANSISHNKGAV